MDSVSVIITTRNEEKHIGNCIESVKNQTYSDIEIVVVDNNSDDRTKEIAKEKGAKVYDKGPERSAQRNYGVEKSTGKYILYLDADMILSPDVVNECVEAVSNPKMAGLYVPERIIGKGFWIKVRDFEREFYNGTVVDCVRFIPRRVFDYVKGFDLTMTGPEDWDFDKKVRLTGDVKLICSQLYHNEGSFDLKKYLEKKKYYSHSFKVYVKKWGRDDDIKKQLGAFYRLFGVFIADRKIVRLALHPVLTLGMYYLRLRVALNYLRRLK